ncbi:ABC transporter permease [Hydrogenophaga sp.]|uniref:ABC transporter permease n=1 Tax=Hydrogenophaga sp. TaxID=1904254 RepID=UPI0035B230B4
MVTLRESAVGLFGRRLAQALPVMLLATLLAFGLLKLVPGDIAVTLAGDNASDQRIAEIRQLYGLDKAFLTQYAEWLWKVVQGDLSRSLLTGEAVLVSIERCLPATLLIVVLAMVFSVLIGAPLGVLAASRQGSWIDSAVMSVGSLGVAIPNFWLAMLLIATLALERGWFPVTGSVAFSQDPLRAIHHAVLPALALAAGGVAEISRQLRGALIELLSSQQVRTLHAKGLSPMAILWKHGLRNVGINLLTVITLLANRMLAATVVIEAVFAVPGMGSLIVNAALQRDFPVVQGVILVMVGIVLLLNLTADMLYGRIDPRVR